jgi:exodeoxyribonuclease VII large subunit
MTETPPLLNIPEFSVGELAAALKRTVESNFERLRVRGEISGLKRHTSGHLYLKLKDADAVLEGVCWRGQVARLGLKPEDGMEVVCTGRLTTYPGRSQYQIVVEAMELAGEGALLKLIEERKRRLAAEGLFDAERKRALPYLPHVIGVVTSPTGAVIRDILHRLAERFPRRVLVWPVAVQGEGAAAQIAAAIAGFNGLDPGGIVPRPDLLIVARGGGSLEDLMPFNEEIVVRAAAASAIPLISAVGHETDTTLIDFASDLRASTPTAAAERAVPVRAELMDRVGDSGRRLVQSVRRFTDEMRIALQGLKRGLGDPGRLLEAASQRLDDRAERLGLAFPSLLRDRQARIAAAAARLPRPQKQIESKAEELKRNAQSLTLVWRHAMTLAATGLERVAGRLTPQAILALRQMGAQRSNDLARRLRLATLRLIDDTGKSLVARGGLLDSFSYQRVLERGFVLVRDSGGRPLIRAVEVKAGDRLTLGFADGEREAVADGRRSAKSSASAAKSSRPGRQGELL